MKKLLALIALVVATCCACSPAKEPDAGTLVEAGAGVVSNGCALLEGVTDNQTVISICATVEEIATIAGWVLTFVRSDVVDAGACTPLPGVCATPTEVGRGIQLVLAKRRALLYRDAGAP